MAPSCIVFTYFFLRGLLRALRDGLVVFWCLPFLDERQELWLTGDVFPQNLGDIETLRCLVVLKDTAKCSFGGAN
jgi:hypothetical protein